MLRNPLRSERRLWAALPLLALGAWLVAPGVAYEVPAVLWPGAALLASGLGLVLWELGGLVALAPRGRMLVASRTGVTLSLFHVLAALTLGAIVFDRGDSPMLGVSHDRWLLVHLHLREVGREVWTWLAEGANIYICGDAKRMAKDVERALVDIVAQFGARTTDEAVLFVGELKKKGRFQQDVY